MKFQNDPIIIIWKIHTISPPEKVFQVISTDEGRNKFWAKTSQIDNMIKFEFPNLFVWKGIIQEHESPTIFSLKYIDNSELSFHLSSDGVGGTDLTLIDQGVDPEFRSEVIAGWGSVLMALKAAVDFDIDLRNHDATRTWDQGYFDN